MTAKEFFDELNLKIKGDNEIKGLYYGKCIADFTYEIMALIRKIFEDKKIKFSNEYYRIDGFAWERVPVNMPVPDEKFHVQSWKPVAAIEHENNSHSWLDEVVKLLYVRCPLKVVICYHSVKKKKEDYADFAAKVIENLGVFPEENEEFLLMIGNTGCKNKPEKYFGYEPFLWNSTDKKFVRQDWKVYTPSL